MCWGSFLTAHLEYETWLQVLRQSPPPKPTLRPGADSSERIQYKDAVLRHAKGVQRMCAEVDAAMHRAVDALVDVLTFEGGWLVPVEEQDGSPGPDLGARVELDEDQFEPEHTRFEELRRRCLPRVAIMLHQTLHETARWQLRADPDNFRASAVLLLQKRYVCDCSEWSALCRPFICLVMC